MKPTYLLALGVMAMLMSPAVAIQTDPVQDAFDRLHAELNLAPTSVHGADPALTPIVHALADAVAIQRATFAELEDPDRFWTLLLQPHTHDNVMRPADQAWMQEQIATVNIQPLNAAADALLTALDGLTGIQASTWISPYGLIEVGGPGNDCYTTERMLIIEPGGDDCYDNYAATGTPWSAIQAPISIILDLGGNDRYSTTNQHPAHPDALWSQGVGIGGIGLLVDRWGDDRYDAQLVNQNNACWGTHLQQVYAQGVGVLGVGAILDASGDDRYVASNVNTLTQSCHWNLAYVFAQGLGMDLGTGLLIDDTGHDRYYAHSEERGDDPDNNAHTNAQGVSIMGQGALVDKEGDDSYAATSHASASVTSGQKGSHAYVFAQASNLQSMIAPDFGQYSSCSTGVKANCLPTSCAVRPAGVADAGTPDCGAPSALLADVLGSDEYRIDVSANSPGYCSYTSRAVGVGQGASGWLGTATLLDIDHGVRDHFDTRASARSEYCPADGHLYVQGFGGELMYDRYDTPRIDFETQPLMHGALLSLGPMEPGRCLYDPKPIVLLGSITFHPADPCALPGRTGLVDSTDIYDAWAGAVNPSGPAHALIHAQGMANKGTPSLPVQPPKLPPKVSPIQQWTAATVADIAADLAAQAPGPLDGVAGIPTPSMIPIGTHVDVAGHDIYRMLGESHGQDPTVDVKGQGAGVNGLGQLYAVGGDDSYEAYAYRNFVPTPTATHVQAYSEASTPWPTTPANGCFTAAGNPPLGPIAPQCVYLGHDLVAGGILVDVFGDDEYTEAAERNNCQQNGYLMGTWPVGPTLGSPNGLGPSFWGTVLSWPCQNVPTATTGNSISIGADWWSDHDAW